MFDKALNLIPRYLMPLLTGIFALRVGYLLINGLDLIGDESYYWDWSRRPDWCYFSKPPMIAWLIAASTGLGGDNTPVVRLPAVFLGTVFLGYLYATTAAFYSSKSGTLAVLLILAMPFNVLANIVMTIDSPLYCFWIMSLYYLHQALFKQQISAWFWAGIATGGALLSKQVALLIPLMLAVFLLLDHHRHRLFKREFLLYLLPIILCTVPMLLWNQHHDWVMFTHSQGHFVIKKAFSLVDRLEQIGTFVLYQLLLVSPVIFIMILMMTYKASIGFTRLSAEEQFLMLMGPMLLLGIFSLSLIQKVQGNWSMPFYFSAVMLLSGQYLAGKWQKSLKIGLALGYLMVLLTYALPMLAPIFRLHHATLDPTYRFKHWRTVVETIAPIRKKALPNTEKTIIIALGHRFLASQLAFYLPDHPVVYRYEASGQSVSQYEVWGWPEDVIGKTALIVADKHEAEIPAALKSAFQYFHEIADVANPMNDSKRFHLFVGENLRVRLMQPKT